MSEQPLLDDTKIVRKVVALRKREPDDITELTNGRQGELFYRRWP